ncbi:hypothetical protein CIB48_g9267 [Xylaria polymorpha]|nr:hypothetical protein CIB48_g9267 [Xylaria polymorpha]
MAPIRLQYGSNGFNGSNGPPAVSHQVARVGQGSAGQMQHRAQGWHRWLILAPSTLLHQQQQQQQQQHKGPVNCKGPLSITNVAVLWGRTSDSTQSAVARVIQSEDQCTAFTSANHLPESTQL